MAYDVFQATSKAPNIDVNLFPNAATAGINAGNALPSTTKSIIDGLTTGVKTGLDIQGKILANEAQAAKNEVETDPRVIQAEKDRAIAEAQIKQAEAKIKANENSAEVRLKKMETDLKLQQTEEKLGDLTNQDTITTALKNPNITPEELVGLGKQSLGTFGRNNAFAEQMMAEFKKKGVPDSDLNEMRTIFNAEERAKQDAERVQKQQDRLIAQRDKNEEKIALATQKLMGGSENMRLLLTRKQRGENYNPELLDIVPNNQLTADPNKEGRVLTDKGRVVLDRNPATLARKKDDTTYAGIYDGQVVDYFDEERGKKLQDSLDDYRLDFAPDIASTRTTEEVPKPGGTAAPEISADQYALDRETTGFNVDKTKIPTGPTPEELEGKTPEGIARMQASFQRRVTRAGQVSREYRDVVRRVESDPLLSKQVPLVKAIASVESSGIPNSVSETNVKGFVGMTKKTFEGLMAMPQYKDKLTPEMFETEAGKIVASQYLMFDLAKKGIRDLPSILVAYNAGEDVVFSARTASGTNNFDDPRFQEALENAVNKKFPPPAEGKSKWEKETKNYAKKVMRYYEIYSR